MLPERRTKGGRRRQQWGRRLGLLPGHYGVVDVDISEKTKYHRPDRETIMAQPTANHTPANGWVRKARIADPTGYRARRDGLPGLVDLDLDQVLRALSHPGNGNSSSPAATGHAAAGELAELSALSLATVSEHLGAAHRRPARPRRRGPQLDLSHRPGRHRRATLSGLRKLCSDGGRAVARDLELAPVRIGPPGVMMMLGKCGCCTASGNAWSSRQKPE